MTDERIREIVRVMWARRFVQPITTIGVEMWLPEGFRLAATLDGDDIKSPEALRKAIKQLATPE